MRIPFICVSYNSSLVTIKYIENIRSLSNNQIADIFVVDNSSDPVCSSDLENYLNNQEDTFKERIHIIKVKNEGYLRGLNAGLKYANKILSNYSYAVLSNNDVTFEDNFIDNLNKIVLEKDVFIVAPDVVNTFGSRENPHVINKMGVLQKWKYDLFFSNYYLSFFLNTLRNKKAVKPFYPEKMNIHMGIGAIYILTDNFFRNFEYLWDSVFLFGEEAIISGQVKSVNGKILYDPSLKCFHQHSNATSKLTYKQLFDFSRESYKVYRKYL